ncbi:TonB-dependent siderophore receptor [Leptolyngbya sp. NK1-12]|uniref:TonB-dependent siderophore receptor n=1 Tax=Leptolyngbya sp. NK1-12 TaxID=2547451 RepID=A0AA97AFR4_9CYAN|nr:TonB-dependent siderophore receptor [Leptolyngbya sp. NK1-12]WNZ22664.1 TonB-dependent siderophore receptor [Leptolyngbya sp. NK1-12]
MQRWQRVGWAVVVAVVGNSATSTTAIAGEVQSEATPEVPVEVPVEVPIEPAATTVSEWVAQIEAALLQITRVRVEVTETGLQVILETADGSLPVPETRSIGNALIADIPNATIAEEFSQAEPIEGIALVSVTQLPNNRVRVAITGTDVPPVAEVTSEAQGLAFAVTLGDAETATEEDAIQVVVTGEQDEGYNPSNATTATRTDAPLWDIPQAITVIPRQVLEDRNVRTVNEAIQTVPSVVDGGDIFGSPAGGRLIRGFDNGFSAGGTDNLRDGVPDGGYIDIVPIGTTERVEVLRGPASILYGNVEPGGVVNRVTRQPLSEPYYQVALEVGNYGYVQPSIDLSGSLTADENVLYRLIAGYERSDYIQPFVEEELITIAPSLTVNLGDQTNLNFYYEYARFFSDAPKTDAAFLSDGSLTPRDLYLGYPIPGLYAITTHRLGYRLRHEFSENLQLRHNFAISLAEFIDNRSGALDTIEDDRFFTLGTSENESTQNRYFGQIDLLAKFETGSIAHQLLIGFDARHIDDHYTALFDPNVPVFDIRNPNYDYAPDEVIPEFDRLSRLTGYAVYLQDQIELSDNWNLLVGGRYDWLSNDTQGGEPGELSTREGGLIQNDGAFSPRIGIVYQPSDAVSLYASYSRSFAPTFGVSRDDSFFEPSRGTQYEVGVRTDWLDRRLSTTLAAYQITKTNVTTDDPDNPDFQIQTGEQRSRGIELEIGGEILPGWNIIASYAYTDAEVTEDTVFAGNQVGGVPEHQASLWTTYQIQSGILEGLGFGLGLFYVGERPGDVSNTQTLDSYFRTDAALYYRRDRFNAAINVSNLFDNDYALAGSGVFAVRNEPFTITGSVSWKF